VDTVRSTPKARKEHWCDVCGWAIEPGEVYERAVTFDAGDAWTWKTHATPCAIATHRATEEGYCDWQSGLAADPDDVALWADECAPTTDVIAAEMRRRYEINTERARERAGKESDR
jgi:hypothetical protein